MQVSVCAATDVGMQRTHNQDRLLVADLTSQDTAIGHRVRRFTVGARGALFVVADGMGGAAGGEVASQMAVDLIYEHLATRWTVGNDQGPRTFAARIRESIEGANARIHARAQEQVSLLGMGTTATVLGVLGGTLVVSQVGDSRAYLVRRRSILQLTRDQSVVQELVEAGMMGREEAEASNHRGVLLQALGPKATLDVVQEFHQLCRGDLLVACSDGLSGLVDADEIRSAVGSGRRLGTACRKLVELANERGGPDNITVLAMRVDGGGLPAASGG